MKKLFFLAIAGALITSCKKEATVTETITVPQVQKTLLIYKGATWCGPCGQYGKPVLRAMEAVGTDKIVCFASQTNDGLNSTAGDAVGGALMTRYNQNGIPHMFEGGNETWNHFYPDQNTAQSTMLSTNSASAIANAYLTASLSGSTITIKGKSKFFKDATGTYSVAAYILQDSIIKTQTSSTNPRHDNVMVANAGTNPLGETLAATATKAGVETEFSYTVPLNSNWYPNYLKAAIVIWKISGTNFDPVNVSETKVIVK
jgi:hypothetical protein